MKIPLKEGLFHISESPNDPFHLIGSKCSNCGYIAFPKARVCPSCMKLETMSPVRLSQRGKLDTFAIVQQAPAGFTPPHMMAYVTLPEKVRIFTLLSGVEPRWDALEIGQEMELVMETIRKDKDGNEIVGWKFKPVASAKG